jgi:predicted nucleotidyltransferase
MIELIQRNQGELEKLCRRYRVQTLEVFGSASDGTFDPARSDLDFLVRFAASEPRIHYECYFGMLEGLRALFAWSIDLVEADAMRNPYFIRCVEGSRRLLYAA